MKIRNDMPRAALLFTIILALLHTAGTCSEPNNTQADVHNEDTADNGNLNDAAIIPKDTVAGPAFELGTHPQRANHPSQWRPLSDTIDVELGGQGLWMIVLGFRTREIFTADVEITGTLSIPGRELGTLTLSRQQLLHADDSCAYFYDFFLALDIFDISVDGVEATLVFSVTGDPNPSEHINETHTLTLRGGP